MPSSEPMWDEVRYPGFDGRLATEIEEWADDPQWPQRFTHYTVALQYGAEILADLERGVADEQECQELFERLADPSLGVWQGLDTSRRLPHEQGRFLLTEVLEPAIDEAVKAYSDADPSTEPLLAWYTAFRADSRQKRSALYRKFSGRESDGDINVWLYETAWYDGLHELEHPVYRRDRPTPSLTPERVPALRRLTAAIDARLDAERVREPGFGWDAPLDGLLPPDIAEELMKRTRDLKHYRDRILAEGRQAPGIDEHGYTELWRLGLPVLRRRLAQQRSMLLVGPTTTGKTDFSRIAAASTIWQRKKVIVLLPTRALVSQAAEEWRSFFATCPSSAEWKVLEASRDHPYNDEDIARGDYDIILAIPEKLAAYLASGSRMLDACGLLVVDELQTLGQVQRGVNLESLLTIVKAQRPRLPILGLSATLTQESSENLRAWIGVGDDPSTGFIATRERPVALDLYASHPLRWRRRSQDGEVAHDTWQPPLDDPELTALLKEGCRLKQPAHVRAVQLATRLLRRPDAIQESKSVLIFVGSRSAAEIVTRGVRLALDHVGFGETAVWHNPYYGRFGRLVMSEQAAAERATEFTRLPDLPATRDVGEGLSTGVMYHTARLDAEHRRIIEQAFKDKIIRVIVATATLAVGMNLPADFVIVADVTEGTKLSENGRAVNRLLDPHEMAQRFGRCGRLQMSTQGEAYVVVQDADRQRQLLVTDEQTEFFTQRLESQGRAVPNPLAPAINEELATLDGIFEYFVMSDDTGETIASNLDDEGFARLLLQDLCRHTPALLPEEIQARIERVYEVSLLRTEGRECPSYESLIDLLDSSAAPLIGLAPEDNSRFKITGLGRTIALSNVPLANARGIREVAAAALVGAGPLTLLAIAAQAEYVKSMTWLGVPRYSNASLVDQVRSRMWALVQAFGQEGAAPRSQFPAPGFLDVIESGAPLIGHGQSAQALRGRVELDVGRLADHTIVAHLRACIAYLWLRGYPMNPLISFITENTKTARRHETLSMEAYPADIRDLGERLSYVFNAASEVLRISPEAGQHLMLKNIAEGLQSGLPYQLAPLLRLREPRIHRERLATLVDGREDELDFDDLRSVLQTLSTPRSDRTAPQKRVHAHLGFTEAEVAEILKQMTKKPQLAGAFAVPHDIRDKRIPSRRDLEGGVTYGRIADDMHRTKALDRRAVELAKMLEEFGLDVEIPASTPARAAFAIRRAGVDGVMHVHLLPELLDKAGLSRFRGKRACLVSFEGVSPGAEHELRSTPENRLSAMTIWTFIAALARIDQGWRANYFGDDPDGELARRVMDFFMTAVGPISLADVSLVEVAAGLPAPPPFFA